MLLLLLFLPGRPQPPVSQRLRVSPVAADQGSHGSVVPQLRRFSADGAELSQANSGQARAPQHNVLRCIRLLSADDAESRRALLVGAASAVR